MFLFGESIEENACLPACVEDLKGSKYIQQHPLVVIFHVAFPARGTIHVNVAYPQGFCSDTVYLCQKQMVSTVESPPVFC